MPEKLTCLTKELWLLWERDADDIWATAQWNGTNVLLIKT